MLFEHCVKYTQKYSLKELVFLLVDANVHAYHLLIIIIFLEMYLSVCNMVLIQFVGRL